MKYLLDTNVLARTAERSHALRPAAIASAQALLLAGHELFLVPQVLYEFWVVSTRPKAQIRAWAVSYGSFTSVGAWSVVDRAMENGGSGQRSPHRKGDDSGEFSYSGSIRFGGRNSWCECVCGKG